MGETTIIMKFSFRVSDQLSILSLYLPWIAIIKAHVVTWPNRVSQICQKDVRKYFFSHRVIDRWNALDGEAVSSSGINAFKNRLNKIRMTRMGYFMTSSD